MYFVYGGSGPAADVPTTHIDDILGCGEPDILAKARKFPVGRFGKLEVQEGSFVHVGMELAHEKDFSATLTEADFAKNVKLLPTSPEPWAGRREPSSLDHIKLRQCKLGELCWVATVSRPDLCARLARIASRINALCGSDVCRIHGLVRAVKDWQQATVLKYAPPSHPWKTLGRSDRVAGELKERGGQVHGGSMTMVGWSDAACGY